MNHWFHYTVGHKLPLIAASDQLEPTRANITPRERPVLWFSRHRQWEPTATKAFMSSNGPMLMTFTQMVEILGVYRFGLPTTDKRLVPWRRLPQLAHIPAATVAHMVAVGVQRGAKPRDWLGTFVPVSLADTCIEGWRDGAWVPMTLAEAIASSPAQQRSVASARLAEAALQF